MAMAAKVEGALPYLGMVLAQFAQVGLMIIGKAAMSSGMTNFTWVFYPNALAALLLLPAFFFQRSTRPPLTFSLICWFFLMGILGCSAQLTGYTGINYTSSSFASAMLNLIPGFTFLLAIICRMEKLDLGSSSTMAKCIGTIVSIVGAFIATLCKGPQILTNSTSSRTNFHHLNLPQVDWIIGGAFLLVDCLVSSAFLVVQASILKNYPAELIVVFFYFFFTAILSAVIALIVGGDLNAWMLTPDMRWLAVLYSGFFGSAFQVSVMVWCVRRKGPVFVALFHPLGIVIAAALGIIFLGDIFYVGSLVGSVIIVIGFYCVKWGKAKEMKVANDSLVINIESSGEKAPLLENKDGETGI
nr:WAT1-related protein At3g28050-like [Ipomoea batatas]